MTACDLLSNSSSSSVSSIDFAALDEARRRDPEDGKWVSWIVYPVASALSRRGGRGPMKRDAYAVLLGLWKMRHLGAGRWENGQAAAALLKAMNAEAATTRRPLLHHLVVEQAFSALLQPPDLATEGPRHGRRGTWVSFDVPSAQWHTLVGIDSSLPILAIRLRGMQPPEGTWSTELGGVSSAFERRCDDGDGEDSDAYSWDDTWRVTLAPRGADYTRTRTASGCAVTFRRPLPLAILGDVTVSMRVAPLLRAEASAEAEAVPNCLSFVAHVGVLSDVARRMLVCLPDSFDALPSLSLLQSVEPKVMPLFF